MTGIEYRQDRGVAEQAMLARLTVSSYAGFVKDADVSRAVAEDAGAAESPDAVGYYRKRLVRKEALADIQATGSALRTTHHMFTMPWDDGHYRLLPVALHEQYRTRMDMLIERRTDAANALLSGWDGHIAEAQTRLGDLFDESYYPTAADLADRLGAGYHFAPVPDARHFAVAALEHDVAERIRSDFERQVASRIEGTVLDLYGRLRDTTSAIAERLADDGDAPKVFRDSLITNLTGLLDILPALNLTGSADINDLADELAAAIDGVAPDALRPTRREFDPDARERVRDTAQAVSERLAGYFGDMPQ